MDTASSREAARDSREPFNPPSIKFAKRAARRLQMAYYLVEGKTPKLSSAQEAVARAYGYKDWFSLSRQLERDGYLPSSLDNALAEQEITDRLHQHRLAIEGFFSLLPGPASSISLKARLSASTSTIARSGEEPEAPRALVSSFPKAEPRPGLEAIFLTAIPYSSARGEYPLPGWQHYAVIAAPLDNSALWLRFCDRQELQAELGRLVIATKELSGGALTKAYVPSPVLAQASGLKNFLAAHGVAASGGREAIMAARLKGRLSSAIFFQTNADEAPPSQEELVAIFNLERGLLEVPDAKNQPANIIDFRSMMFARAVLESVRASRWAEPSNSTPQVPDPVTRERDFGDTDHRFKSGIQVIPRGVPVYRILVELPLVDDNESERHANINRVIEVPADYDLWDLHIAIQDAMGWADCHLHEFTFYPTRNGRKANRFSSPNPDDEDDPMTPGEPLAKHVLSFTDWPAAYCYDFGDNWKHRIRCVGAFPSDGGSYPRCISGELACPPEDCGSDPGYFRVLDVLAGGAAARRHSDDVTKKEMVAWLKNHVNVTWPYLPQHFDPKSVRFDDPQDRWDYAYGGKGDY